MDFQPIKVALFAGLVAPEGFLVIKMAALDTVVIAGCNGKTVDDVNRVTVQLLPGFAQQVEQGQEQVSDPMLTTIETAFAQDVRNIASFLKMRTGLFRVSAKVKRSQNGNRHHFRIRDLALGIVSVIECRKHIVRQAIYCYNLGVHAFLRLVLVWAPITLPEYAWTF
jgi:hypothetical protein